jgi:ribonuclease J
VKACIHRGAHQIGGTAIEVEHEGARLLLDLGLPLDAGEASPDLLPAVPGLREADPSLLAVVLSHGHADHWGLAPVARPGLPVIVGAAAEAMQAAAARTFGREPPFRAQAHLRHRAALPVGPFRITPYIVCHSGFDAYALLVEAGGRRLFYSGDLRAHGRKARMFEALVRHPPREVHAMLMEGSSLGRLDPDARFASEADVETRLLSVMREAPGLVLVAASAQNVDRVVSIYRAAKRAGRRLVLDLYATEVLEATGNRRIPSPLFPDVRFYLPWLQGREVRKREAFDLIEGARRERRLYSRSIAAEPGRYVVLFNRSFMQDRYFAPLIPGARAVWSQWDGYLRPGGHGERLAADLAPYGVKLESIHTSGHADVPTLRRLVAALRPAVLSPVHTFHPERFEELFGDLAPVALRTDGVWWSI